MDERLQRRVQRYGWDKAVDHYEAHWRSQLPSEFVVVSERRSEV